MKLFSRHLIDWNEPTLFPARIRDRRGWMYRGLLTLAIFALMLGGFVAQAKWGRGPQFSPAGSLGMSALIGVLLVLMLDAPSLNRTISINESGISAFGNAGTIVSNESWPLANLASVRLVTPEEWGRPFGMMEVITARGGVGRLGIPSKMPPSKIAQVLHDLGIAVELTGWRPAQEIAAEELARRSNEAPIPLPPISAKIQTLPEVEAGRIMAPGHFAAAAAMALVPFFGPILLGVGLLVTALARLAWLGAGRWEIDAWLAAGGVAAVIAGGWFGLNFSDLMPSLYLRRVARSVVGMRPEAIIDPRSDDVLFVDVVPRANWGTVQLNNAADTGFLRVDPRSRTVMFEGDRERWTLPAASLVSVEVETYLPPGAAEGEPQALVYSVTVIRARSGDAVWEGSVTPCHVEARARTSATRAEAAAGLRDRIRALRSEWSAIEDAARQRTRLAEYASGKRST